ncbi:unnamed protein product [Amoebophrya sp. A120]|nr:unnamed protein product [Amoebophrya sp. A120]|eukprot:GSA120T00021315001.1
MTDPSALALYGCYAFALAEGIEEYMEKRYRPLLEFLEAEEEKNNNRLQTLPQLFAVLQVPSRVLEKLVFVVDTFRARVLGSSSSSVGNNCTTTGNGDGQEGRNNNKPSFFGSTRGACSPVDEHDISSSPGGCGNNRNHAHFNLLDFVYAEGEKLRCAETRAVFGILVKRLATAFVQQLSAWCVHGVLHDPFSEFVIEKKKGSLVVENGDDVASSSMLNHLHHPGSSKAYGFDLSDGIDYAPDLEYDLDNADLHCHSLSRAHDPFDTFGALAGQDQSGLYGSTNKPSHLLSPAYARKLWLRQFDLNLGKLPNCFCPKIDAIDFGERILFLGKAVRALLLSHAGLTNEEKKQCFDKLYELILAVTRSFPALKPFDEKRMSDSTELQLLGATTTAPSFSDMSSANAKTSCSAPPVWVMEGTLNFLRQLIGRKLRRLVLNFDFYDRPEQSFSSSGTADTSGEGGELSASRTTSSLLQHFFDLKGFFGCAFGSFYQTFLDQGHELFLNPPNHVSAEVDLNQNAFAVAKQVESYGLAGSSSGGAVFPQDLAMDEDQDRKRAGGQQQSSGGKNSGTTSTVSRALQSRYDSRLAWSSDQLLLMSSSSSRTGEQLYEQKSNRNFSQQNKFSLDPQKMHRFQARLLNRGFFFKDFLEAGQLVQVIGSRPAEPIGARVAADGTLELVLEDKLRSTKTYCSPADLEGEAGGVLFSSIGKNYSNPRRPSPELNMVWATARQVIAEPWKTSFVLQICRPEDGAARTRKNPARISETFYNKDQTGSPMESPPHLTRFAVVYQASDDPTLVLKENRVEQALREEIRNVHGEGDLFFNVNENYRGTGAGAPDHRLPSVTEKLLYRNAFWVEFVVLNNKQIGCRASVKRSRGCGSNSARFGYESTAAEAASFPSRMNLHKEDDKHYTSDGNKDRSAREDTATLVEQEYLNLVCQGFQFKNLNHSLSEATLRGAAVTSNRFDYDDEASQMFGGERNNFDLGINNNTTTTSHGFDGGQVPLEIEIEYDGDRLAVVLQQAHGSSTSKASLHPHLPPTTAKASTNNYRTILYEVNDVDLYSEIGPDPLGCGYLGIVAIEDRQLSCSSAYSPVEKAAISAAPDHEVSSNKPNAFLRLKSWRHRAGGTSDDMNLVIDPWHRDLSIAFDVPWPLSLIISYENLAAYNRLFRLLFAYKRALYGLSRIWLVRELNAHRKNFPTSTCIAGGVNSHSAAQQQGYHHDYGTYRARNKNQFELSNRSRRNHHFRHRLYFFVTQILQYFQQDVLEASFQNLVDAVEADNDFEDLQFAHQQFLSHVLADCFLLNTDQSVLKCLLSIVSISNRFVRIGNTSNQATRAAPSSAQYLLMEQRLEAKLESEFDMVVQELFSLLKKLDTSSLQSLLLRLDYNQFQQGGTERD